MTLTCPHGAESAARRLLPHETEYVFCHFCRKQWDEVITSDGRRWAVERHHPDCELSEGPR